MKRYYPLNEQSARTAHEMNSFGSFRSDDAEYREAVDNVYELADAAAERVPERKDEAYRLADTYAQKLADWYNKHYAIESMYPSVLISGAGNFSTRKKEVQNEARFRHRQAYERLENYADKLKRMGTIHEPIKSSDANAVAKLTAKIQRLEDYHAQMKAENAKARKEHKEAPFPPYHLANNRQKIASAKKRLAQLEAAKEAGTSARDTHIMGERVHVIEDADDMRLRLVFDGKPAEEVRTALKSWSFRWSPKNKAWQRQLTAPARYALERLETA